LPSARLGSAVSSNTVDQMRCAFGQIIADWPNAPYTDTLTYSILKNTNDGASPPIFFGLELSLGRGETERSYQSVGLICLWAGDACCCV